MQLFFLNEENDSYETRTNARKRFAFGAFTLTLLCLLSFNQSIAQTKKSSAGSKPTEAEQLLTQAQEAYKNRQPKEAIELVSKSLKLQESSESYLFRAILLERMGRKKAALDDLNRSIEVKETYMNRFERGRVYFQLGMAEHAIADLKRTEQLKPDLRGLHFQLALAYQNVNEFEKANEEFSKVIKNLPDSSIGYYGRGFTYMALNEPLKALADFDRALEFKSMNVSAIHFNKASCYIQSDQPEKSIAEYTAAMPIHNRKSMVLMNRGRAYTLLGKPNQAIVDFDDALKLQPDNERLYMFRGRAYQMKGDLKKAREDLQQATMRETDFAESHYMNDVETMMADDEKRFQMRGPRKAAPQVTSDAEIDRAMKLRAQKKYDAAIAVLDNCIKKNPNTFSLYIARARVYSEKGDHKKAFLNFREAWSMDNINVEAIHGKVLEYKALGDYEHMLPDLNKLIWADPFCPNYYFEKAEVLDKLSRKKEAEKCYRKFLSLIDQYKNQGSMPFTKYSINPKDLVTAQKRLH